jgi:hypothetical protein
MKIGRRAPTRLAGLRDSHGHPQAVRVPPFGGGCRDDSRIPSVAVTRTRAARRSSEFAPSARATRAVAVELDAPEGRDNIVVLLVGGIGAAGIGVMLAIDLVVFRAL